MSMMDPDFREELSKIDERNRREAFDLRQAIEPLCRRHGYGRVMQLVSQWWREKDPVGAISLGPCFGTLEAERLKREARKAKRKAP